MLKIWEDCYPVFGCLRVETLNVSSLYACKLNQTFSVIAVLATTGKGSSKISESLISF